MFDTAAPFYDILKTYFAIIYYNSRKKAGNPMISNLIVAIGAVIPLFFLMLIGVAVKKMRLLTELELAHVNRMVFKIFFFFMMFYNIYTTDIAETFRPHLILFGALGVLASAVIGGIVICLIEKSNKRRGAMIQAIFRSNFVIMGIPIISNIFGDNQLAIPTMMIAIIVPMYNIISVFILETFRGGHFDVWGILRNVLKNPMILGAILGFALLLLGIPLPKVILKPISQIAAATTPIALIILGASFKAGTYHEHLPQLIGCICGRLLIVPAIMLSLAIFLGFRGIELVTLMAIFATPCAVAGFAMAQQMGSDADLAGNCVVYTTGLSCFTIFGWVFVLKTLGMF